MILHCRTDRFKVIHTTVGEWKSFEYNCLDEVELLSYQVCFGLVVKNTPFASIEELSWALYHCSMQEQ